jgi:4'-phosphopantetheinyl transferase
MFLTNKITYRQAEILVIETDETPETLKTRLSNFREYEDELKNIGLKKRLREFLGVRCGVNQLFKENVKVIYHADGKPYLRDKNESISISHSGKFIALITHPVLLSGIDIEVPSKKVMKVASRFLSEKERSYLVDEQSVAIAWSAKEALYKIIGKEAIDFAATLEIQPFNVASSGELLIRFIKDGQDFQIAYEMNDRYTLAYCLDNF